MEDLSTDSSAKNIYLEKYKAKISLYKVIFGTCIVGLVSVLVPGAVEYWNVVFEDRRRTLELEITANQNQQKYVKDFLNTALNQDIELRIRFAEYFSFVSTDPLNKNWEKYRTHLTTIRNATRIQIQENEKELHQLLSIENASIAEQITVSQLERELEWLYKEIGYVERNRSVVPSKDEVSKNVVVEAAQKELCEILPDIPSDFTEYYSSANDLTGRDLKKALNIIIGDHCPISYSELWKALAYLDEDPTDASSIIAFYSGEKIEKFARSTGKGKSEKSWNREHLWAKSHGFPSRTSFAYTDLHNIRPVISRINIERSDKDFGIGNELSEYCSECRKTEDTWEVRNQIKGDVARAMFYMAVRYEGDVVSNTPDLKLVNNKTSHGNSQHGMLCTLLEWNYLDPVSTQEKRRNNLVHTMQKNRNPFVDNPTFAQSIWGSSCKEASNNG